MPHLRDSFIVAKVGIARSATALLQTRISPGAPDLSHLEIGVPPRHYPNTPTNSSTPLTGGKQLIPRQTKATLPPAGSRGNVSANAGGKAFKSRSRTTLRFTAYPRSAARSNSLARSSSPTTQPDTAPSTALRSANP